jgi:hypothetical protein
VVAGEAVEHLADHLDLDVALFGKDAGQETIDVLDREFQLADDGELGLDRLLRARGQARGDIGGAQHGSPRRFLQVVVAGIDAQGGGLLRVLVRRRLGVVG